jgi:hypothetical protein
MFLRDIKNKYYHLKRHYMKKQTIKKKKDSQEIIMDLPEVKDIPGQENVRPPRLREMEDTTISSADEEGDALFDEDELSEQESNVTNNERAMLEDAAEYNSSDDEEELKKAVVDDLDEDDEPLNEETNYKDLGASDLDIPDDFEDDEDEELGKK